MDLHTYKKTYNNSGKERLYYILFFLIWPFGALLSTLKYMKGKHFLFIYGLFCILFCWNMDVTNPERYDDLGNISLMFSYNNIDTADFLNILKKYFSGHQDATRELYLYFMIWFTRLFSDNPHTFFALCSIPYLFFQIKCFRIIIDNPKFHNGWIGFLFIFLFMLPRDIITVQNPRFTTALWLCIYVIMKYYCSNGNWKTLLWLALTPIIHSSFWVFIGLFVVGVFSKHFQNVLMPLVYLSIPFSYMSTEIANGLDITSIIPLPDSLSSWASSYLERETTSKEYGTSGMFWIPILFDFLRRTVCLMVPFLLWKRRRIINEKHKALLSFYLFFYAFVNFMQPVPVLGDRYMWFVQILSIYMLFLAYGVQARKYLIIILIANSWYIFNRYLYKGAVKNCVPTIIFYTPAPYIINEYWGVERMDIIDEGYYYH